MDDDASLNRTREEAFAYCDCDLAADLSAVEYGRGHS